ncbi:glucan synthase 10-like [Trifolium medium]|uniref:Glucan synthase 10-like n=1 Tax=Trifolium medium TaxID=97028 RepID=A0A392PHC2_9FABA|nr:glucan synthase 10-like [Trifolium medium]
MPTYSIFCSILLDFRSKDNVANQREHIVHLLANEQSRLGVPDKTEPDSGVGNGVSGGNAGGG